MQKETKIAIFLGVTIVGALLSGIMYLYVAYNLAVNSVYYAKNIPHGENRHPQLEMVADNLLWLDLPEVEGMRYDFDGHPVIIKKNDENVSESYQSSSDEYIYIYDDIGYFLDGSFEIKYIIKGIEKEPIASYDKQEIIQQIYTLVQPILDYQKEPSVNLQWIFNWKYKERFK